MTRALVRLISLSAVVLSAVWFIVAPDYEPAVTFLAGLAGVLGTILVGRHTENHPHLSVHTQNIDLVARDFHEAYDHALGVFISNKGDTPIHISRALFDNRIPTVFRFRRLSKLPVYPKAFKDNECGAYELKFGDGWYDPQVDIAPRGRVMTYLPLSQEVPDTRCNHRRHGEILLRYSSDGSAGTHRVLV